MVLLTGVLNTGANTTATAQVIALNRAPGAA
jgi:hypothetical protein